MGGARPDVNALSGPRGLAMLAAKANRNEVGKLTASDCAGTAKLATSGENAAEFCASTNGRTPLSRWEQAQSFWKLGPEKDAVTATETVCGSESTATRFALCF